MPIYVYRCDDCGAEEEVLQKADEPPPAKCEKCGKTNTMKRRIAPSNFALKGGGWADDGYA